MGGMPFHLEKGCMGLRFDYLCRTQLVRQFLLAELTMNPNSDPFLIAENITIAGVPTTIHALTDSKTTFMARLEDLLLAEPAAPFDPHERRSSADYQADQV